MNSKMRRTIGRLMDLFVERKYDEIAGWSESQRVPTDAIEEAISKYGGTVIQPPDTFWQFVRVEDFQKGDDGRARWYVCFDLWMNKEVRSDLSVDATFYESSGDLYDIEIDDIHVL